MGNEDINPTVESELATVTDLLLTLVLDVKGNKEDLPKEEEKWGGENKAHNNRITSLESKLKQLEKRKGRNN